MRAFLPYKLARALVFNKIKQMVFGDSILYCVGGGALLDLKQQEFFAAFGVPIYQGYGLTEAAPIISSNSPIKHKFGTSGTLCASIECRLLKDDGSEAAVGENGEIVIRGGNVMKGYFKNPEATAVGPAGRMALHRRPGPLGRGRLPRRGRPGKGPAHRGRRREVQPRGDRGSR